MTEICTYTVIQHREGEFLIYNDNQPLSFVSESGEIIKIWGTEKTALQWLRRKAQAELSRFEVFKSDGKAIYMDYAKDPVFKMGKHEWRKSNVMAMADGIGAFDKLICVHCQKVVRRYRKHRHFREELENCEKHLIVVEVLQ